MGVFHVFQIVQMVANSAMHHIYLKFKILLKVKYYCIAYGINYETIYQIGAKLKNAAEKKYFNDNNKIFSLYNND